MNHDNGYGRSLGYGEAKCAVAETASDYPMGRRDERDYGNRDGYAAKIAAANLEDLRAAQRADGANQIKRAEPDLKQAYERLAQEIAKTDSNSRELINRLTPILAHEVATPGNATSSPSNPISCTPMGSNLTQLYYQLEAINAYLRNAIARLGV